MRNDGTTLQDKLQVALKNYCEYNLGFWHRFPDTKSAGRGNYLKAQPGDYMLLVPGPAILIECKSTAVGASVLTLAYHGPTGKNQIAKHRFWHRAGHPSLYLWGNLATGTAEWHDGRLIVKKINRPLSHCSMNGLLESIPGVISLLRNP